MGSRPTQFSFSAPGPLRLYSTAQLLTLPPPDWLVDNTLPEGALCGIYGPPESTKSFIAIDLACCVATGTSWHGHEVRKGFVLYVAAEGGPGISKRVRAWLTSQDVTAEAVKMAWLIESLSIYGDSGDVDKLMHRLDHEMEHVPVLIIVDTLARCFDGDENQQEDMGRFVAGLDRLRQEYGATILAIHHTRLDGDRERGNTAFRGGTDTMIAVSRTDAGIVVECTKQKDAEHFPPMEFKLVPVQGTDSCIVTRTDLTRGEEKAQKTQQILDVLIEFGPLKWDDWLSLTELPKSTFGRYTGEMSKGGVIVKKNGLYEYVVPT